MFIQEEVRDFEKLEADQKLQLELGTLADELKDIGREIKRCLGSEKKLKNKIFQSRDLCLRELDTNSACAKMREKMIDAEK